MEPPAAVNFKSLPEAKIALFRDALPRARMSTPDASRAARRAELAMRRLAATSGYRAYAKNLESSAPNVHTVAFLTITDEVIRQHLAGCDDSGRDFVMGIYPMLQDETCYFLAADFDKGSWQEDTKAFLETCRQMNLPAVLERSRSGKGGHVWLFFNEAVPATLARKLGSHVLTETMERRPDIGLDSYDRFFPNQDTLPQGGFGNLIALPLQKRPREFGNSVFLDDHLVPLADQWAFLSSIRKLSRLEIEAVVRTAEAGGRVIGVRVAPSDEDDATPWKAPPSRGHVKTPITGPLPDSLELVLGNEIFIAKEGLPPALRNGLIRLAAFQNPEFYKAQAMRLPTYDKPRIIACARDYQYHLGLPRGCLDDISRLLLELKIEPRVRDERCAGEPLNVVFQGELRPEQKLAGEAMIAHETGVLSATTAFGKTVIGAWLIAKRGVNTLVLVHRRQLQMQWIERLSTFLGLPARAIGRIGGGRRKATGVLDVAVVQSLVRKGVVDDLVGKYGQVIVDECHHVSAQSFEQVVRQTKARFVTGLSATTTRKDGHHPIVFMQCGPVRYRLNPKEQAAARPFQHVVIVRSTGFRPLGAANPDVRIQFRDLYKELVADEGRNCLICQEVVEAVRQGRSPIVLTERNDHLDCLARQLAPAVRHLVVLRGGMGRKELDMTSAALATIPADEERVLVATGRYVGEGFDDARLDTLFLTLPVSWRGTIAQYVGRLHRLYDGKREVRVVDYADLNVPMLARMFDRRCKGYEAVGYTIQLPASAVPGWPADVPLPIDVKWKNQYAASVRRLIRDGIEAPLANLFDRVAREPEPDAEGAERARSATEAFLYRRLETLADTAGRLPLER